MDWRKFFIGLGFFALLLFGVPIHVSVDNKNSTNVEDKFQDFIESFNKNYSNHTEYKYRLQAFQGSLLTIDQLNSHRKHKLDARYGLTKFSDMTPHEFEKTHLRLDFNEKFDSKEDRGAERNKRSLSVENLTQRIDWRELGYVSEVKNQKNCGACWAFSTIENMETMYAIKTGKLISLSVQQMIDCAGYENDGCDGGDACLLLDWLSDLNITVHSEDDYPLQLANGQCRLNNASFGVQVDKYGCYDLVGKEEYILSTISKIGPVAVAVNALSWQNYLGGVIQYHCGGGTELMNHAVQIVGYDLTADVPHYIVRNSWGDNFGDNGYLYIAIGKNLCGIANEVSALTIV